jgi:aconitate hydratase
MPASEPFVARTVMPAPFERLVFYRLRTLAEQNLVDLDRMPVTVKILLENLLRLWSRGFAGQDDVRALAGWTPDTDDQREFAFLPSRVLLQDFTGVPAVVDLAAMREAAHRLGANPELINPIVPADLVIDHSVQVDAFGNDAAFDINVTQEYRRNGERYALLRWAQQAFKNFRVVPPDSGIVHQINLELLGKVVQIREENDRLIAIPDTLVGTDSHTTMISGLGILGWGVGGIEAEAVLLGQPLAMLTPEVVGFEMTGALQEGVTATDLVLTVTELLRKHGVVDKFVEFCGSGLSHLSLPDRATLANMAPEYGATTGFFPVDAETIRYLRMTHREPELVDLVERFCKEQTLFRSDTTPVPAFNSLLRLDLSTVEPSLAGPRRPEDRVTLAGVRRSFESAFADPPASRADSGRLPAANEMAEEGDPSTDVNPAISEANLEGRKITAQSWDAALAHGSIVIAAITSCTNTSNPSVMVGAGLLAKKAVERGLTVPRHVKTSLAPGSTVVTRYLERAGLTPYLEALGFNLVGYGCTTCIGNSGPLAPPISSAIEQDDLVVAAVLSGNRNFEGRIHPLVKAAYLASPPLVVAFALAGTVAIDLTSEPLGRDRDGQPVLLRDIWPSHRETQEAAAKSVQDTMFASAYANIFDGDERWRTLPVPPGALFDWDPESTYVREPPFFKETHLEADPITDIIGARALAVLGNAVSTDHISPAGMIARSSPAGQYLIGHVVPPDQFNTYGARRGNDEVMVRGTFANIRLHNALADGREGNWTRHLPSNELMSIYDASVRYRDDRVPLIVLAGQMYGNGSSRDWAAKGPLLLGVRAVIAESFERIHRSNLVGMGILPLQYLPSQGAGTFGLTGREVFDIAAIAAGVNPRQEIVVHAQRESGSELDFTVTVRLDSPTEVEYYRNGGILPMVLRRLIRGDRESVIDNA